MELNALISFPAFLGLAALSNDIIPLLFGDRWKVGTGLCALLCVYQLCNNLQVFFHPALLASGGTGRYVILNVIHTLGVVASCCIGYFFGLYSLVFGLIINSIGIAIPAVLFLKHRIGLDPIKYSKTCIAPALLSGFMWLGTLIPEHIANIPSHSVLLVASKVTFGAVFYCLGICVTAPDQLRYFISIFRGVIVSKALKA
jgi:O-antigen/teichoic acid export membrane protein